MPTTGFFAFHEILPRTTRKPGALQANRTHTNPTKINMLVHIASGLEVRYMLTVRAGTRVINGEVAIGISNLGNPTRFEVFVTHGIVD